MTVRLMSPGSKANVTAMPGDVRFTPDEPTSSCRPVACIMLAGTGLWDLGDGFDVGTGRDQPASTVFQSGQDDQPGPAGRRRAWRLYLGRARPAAGRKESGLRRAERDQRRRDE